MQSDWYVLCSPAGKRAGGPSRGLMTTCIVDWLRFSRNKARRFVTGLLDSKHMNSKVRLAKA